MKLKKKMEQESKKIKLTVTANRIYPVMLKHEE